MIVEAAIRIVSPILGDTMDNSDPSRPIFRLLRSDGGVGAWDIRNEMWRWWMASASPDGAAFIGRCVRQPREIVLPTLHLYERSYLERGKERRSVSHESIRKGTVLRFTFFVGIEPTDEEAHSIESVVGNLSEDRLLALVKKTFDNLGNLIGISPWGSSKGFGRFDVVAIKKSSGNL